MPLNDPYEHGTVRAPRMKVLNNGAEIGGALSFHINSNNWFSADTFTVTFAFYATVETPLAFWADEAWDQEHPLMLDIQASLDGGATWVSILIGQVDHITAHIEKGIVEVEGRDRSAVFIDAKTQRSFLNQTSSQVVQTLASEHGLIADVTPTPTLVGRYYEIDHERINGTSFQRTTTEWNLMVSLAQHEQYDLFVTGNVIHFHPKTPRDADPYLLIWDKANLYSNAIELTVQRSLTFAKDIIVVVRSWNSKTQKSITKFAPSGARNAAITSGKAEQFPRIIPNLSEAEAQDAANRIRADLTAHERLLEFSRPADLTLNARNMVKLQGTGSSWDTVYFIDNISRSMHFDEGGFVMRVKAKNVPTESATLSS